MDPSSSKNVNLPPNINLDLTLGPASNNDLENPNTPSSVGSKAEVNANDYSPNTVSAPALDPSNVNLDLNLGPASNNDVNHNTPSSVGSKAEVNANNYSVNPVPAPALEPSNVNLDLNLGPASKNDVENPNTPSSVGSKAEVNANDYSPNPAPANVNLPLVGTKRQRGEEGVINEWIDGDINEWIDRHKDEDVDLDHVNDKLAKTYELPSDFRLVVLRRYQKEFLAWALKQEQSDVKGGILADEEGMGKTIQAISLVLAKGEQPDETMGNTLVICRGTDVPHWETEFKKFGDVKVHEYQGPNRNGTKEVFTKCYFVLTTYHTVKTEYRRDRVSCPLHSVKWNRIILDEADDRGIKNRYSQASEAVFALEATYRWALTSTPLLNNLQNLGSMMWFLRIDPYGSYVCADCECKPTEHIAENKSCPRRTCRHLGQSHIYWWTKFVMKRVQDYRDPKSIKRGKILLKHKVLKGILIRRTKRSREADLAAH